MKKLLVIVSMILMLIAGGCSSNEVMAPVDVSQTIFAQFKEQGFASLAEAEAAIIKLYVDRDYKALVDNSTADSMFEAILDYDGTADFDTYFSQYLADRVGLRNSSAATAQLVQAWQADDGKSAHYHYKVVYADGQSQDVTFAIVNKGGKFLLDHTLEKYVIKQLYFKFNSSDEVYERFASEALPPANVVMPILMDRCVDQDVARPWRLWIGLASEQPLKMRNLKLVTTSGSFDVKLSGDIDRYGAIFTIESPDKFGKVLKALATDHQGKTIEMQAIKD